MSESVTFRFKLMETLETLEAAGVDDLDCVKQEIELTQKRLDALMAIQRLLCIRVKEIKVDAEFEEEEAEAEDEPEHEKPAPRPAASDRPTPATPRFGAPATAPPADVSHEGQRILKHLRDHGPKAGDELRRAIGMHHFTFAKALKELRGRVVVKAGRLELP